MSRIIALCIEDCRPASEDLRYLRCCALTGLQPGLTLSPEGVVVWKEDGAPAAVRLVVSQDEKLVCYREKAAPGVARVHRGGRFVDVEELKPVVLLDGDEITLGERRLRLHVHGFTAASHDPEFYVAPGEASHGGVARAAGVAGVAMAGLMAMTGCDKPPPDKPMEKPPIDVRNNPPSPLEPEMEPPMDPVPPPMEVRDQPPVAIPEERLAPPPPPMEPVMEPIMDPVNRPIEMRPMPPVKPMPMRDDRNPVLPKPPVPPVPPTEPLP